MDQQIRASFLVMRTLLRSVVVKTELSQKAKLLMYWSHYVPTLTHGREVRVNSVLPLLFSYFLYVFSILLHTAVLF